MGRTITVIQADIVSTNNAKAQGNVEQWQIDLWDEQLKGFDEELKAAEEEQQHSQQAQAQQIGGLKEIIRSIRDAVYLKELMDRALGLTENEKNMQDFNSMVDQAVDEDLSALYGAFNTQLEQRDERFRALTSQALDVQNQLDKANTIIQSQAETIQLFEKTIFEFKTDAALDADSLNQKDAEISRLEKLLEEEKSHTFDLQKALNDAPAPKPAIDITPTAASESLSERIAQAKENSKLQLANVKHIAANWVEGINAEGNKEIAHVSAVEHVTEFPSIPAIPAITEQVEQFPEENTNHDVHGGGAQAAEGNQTVHELVQPAVEETTVTLQSLKAELDELKSAHEVTASIVAKIKEHANLPLSA